MPNGIMNIFATRLRQIFHVNEKKEEKKVTIYPLSSFPRRYVINYVKEKKKKNKICTVHFRELKICRKIRSGKNGIFRIRDFALLHAFSLHDKPDKLIYLYRIRECVRVHV